MEPIATEEMVFAVADALTAEGVQPSSRRVRDRIGGGSLATIQRHLRAWRGAGDSGRGDPPPPAAASAESAPDMAAEMADVAARLDLLAKAVVAMGRNLDKADAPDLSGALDALDTRLSVIAAAQREEVAQLAQRLDAPVEEPPQAAGVDPLDALGAQIAALGAAVTVELDALRIAAENPPAAPAVGDDDVRSALEALAAAQQADSARFAARLDAIETTQAQAIAALQAALTENAAAAAARDADFRSVLAAGLAADTTAIDQDALDGRLGALEAAIASAAEAATEAARGADIGDQLSRLADVQQAETARLNARVDGMEAAIASAAAAIASAAQGETARGAEIVGAIEALAAAAAEQRADAERVSARLGAIEAALAALSAPAPASESVDAAADLAAAVAPLADRVARVGDLVAEFAARPAPAARPVFDPAQRVALDGVGRSVEAVDARLTAVEDVVRQIYRHAVAVDDRLAGSLIATLTPEAAAELNAGPAPAPGGGGLAPPEMLRLLAAAMTPLAEEVRRLSAERRRLIASGPEPS